MIEGIKISNLKIISDDRGKVMHMLRNDSPVFKSFGLYREVIRYVNSRALWRIIQAATVYGIAWGLIVFMARIDIATNFAVPRSVILINIGFNRS